MSSSTSRKRIVSFVLIAYLFCEITTSAALSLVVENKFPESIIEDRRLLQRRPFRVIKRENCIYKPGYRKANRNAELRCCDFWEKRFYRRWFVGNEYLTSFLEIMKGWHCPQLKKHCQKKFFNFSPFTNVAYMRTCSSHSYRNHCLTIVNDVALRHTNGRHNSTLSVQNLTGKTWQKMVEGLRSKDMTDDELTEPCVQVALYEGARGGHGRYHEAIKTLIPFCGFAWCGYDSDTVYGRHVSVWKCMPTRCRVGIATTAAAMLILGLVILIANVLVIAVYWYRARMNNSQVVYKVTLAVGDLLVGAIVLPTFASTMMIMTRTRSVMGDLMEGETPNQTWNGEELPPRRMPNGVHLSLSRAYVNAVGFFTIASFLTSVYTLMLASFDRMVAIGFPMTFIRSKALRVAKYSCSCLIILVFIIATLPIYVNIISYRVVASIIISMGLEESVVFYCVIILLPLVLVWVSNAVLIIYNKKYSAIRRAISSASNTQITQSERRLAKTLSIMVGAFTLTLLPVVLMVTVSLFTHNVHLDNPENLDETAAAVYCSAEIFAAIILSTNSLWNYFIYGSRDKDFKQHSRAVARAIADRVGLLYLWKRLNLSSRRRSTLPSLSSAFTSLSSAKASEARRKSRPSKGSIYADIPKSESKKNSIATVSVKKLNTDESF